jgi:hypothetical protein
MEKINEPVLRFFCAEFCQQKTKNVISQDYRVATLLFLSVKTSVAKPSGSCFFSVVVYGCQTAAQTITWRVLAVTPKESLHFCVVVPAFSGPSREPCKALL